MTDILKSQSKVHIGQINDAIGFVILVKDPAKFLYFLTDNSFCFENLLVAEERIKCLSAFAMELPIRRSAYRCIKWKSFQVGKIFAAFPRRGIIYRIQELHIVHVKFVRSNTNNRP
jgi:hypothetical protein